jgi:hypothetical protein
MSRTPLTPLSDALICSTAASVLIAAAARLQDLSVALERGNKTRELARTADHAVRLAAIAVRDVSKVTRALARVRRRGESAT